MKQNKTDTASTAHDITPAVYRISEAARLLHCSQRTVRRLLKDGVIRALPQIRHILIPKGEIDRLLEFKSVAKTSSKGA